jgi:hypothetical protein
MGRPILLASPHLRKEYALRHHGLTPTVQLNDVAMRNEQKRFLPTFWSNNGQSPCDLNFGPNDKVAFIRTFAYLLSSNTN